MSVSVAMATYLGAPYVESQLRSIVEQTVPPAEVVVCDDRSTDGTAQVVSAFAAGSAVPIRLVVNDERLGWRGNFMRAASLCRSDIIAFCDQDDVWDPRKLEVVVAGFARFDALMVFHDATIVGPDLHPIEPFLQGDGEPDRAGALERRPWRDVYGFTVAFRRELLELWEHWPSSIDKSVGDQRAAHDQWLLFLGSALGTTLHLPEPLALYRQHERNAVGVKDAFRPPPRLGSFLRYRDVVNLRLVVLDRRVGTLGEIARRPGRFAAAAATALEVHGRYRDRMRLQTAVYSSTRLRTRLRALVRLVSGGAYARGAWALGRAQVVEDAVAAVLGPDVLARLSRIEARRSAPRSRTTA